MNIKQTRKALRLTLRDAAAAIGKSPEAVRQAEDGHAPKAAGELAKFYKSESAKQVRTALQTKGTNSMEIKFKFSLEDDGSIRVQYAGNGPNVESVVDLIVNAIAADENMTASKVRKSK